MKSRKYASKSGTLVDALTIAVLEEKTKEKQTSFHGTPLKIYEVTRGTLQDQLNRLKRMKSGQLRQVFYEDDDTKISIV